MLSPDRCPHLRYSIWDNVHQRKGVRTMAWGIMMTVVTLVGMLGLVMFEVSQQKPPASNDGPEAVVSEAVEQQRAA